MLLVAHRRSLWRLAICSSFGENKRKRMHSISGYPDKTQFLRCYSDFPTDPLISNVKPLFCSIHPPQRHARTIPFFAPTLIFFLVLFFCLSLRVLCSLLPRDLPRRWDRLFAIAEQTEALDLPSHLFQAVIASEDRRFFQHCGVDPAGICRAILSLSTHGGGSTITQQLVKNVFLSNERKISRKVVEMVLSLILERQMSKRKILCAYLGVVYWGHGIYGIESASAFYFGKRPSCISLGESALLVGILPCPEGRSPLREPNRAKRYQARTLKRMIKAGYLDTQTALMFLEQSMYLRDGRGEIHGKESGKPAKLSALKRVWDWEKESSILELKEEMEEWADMTQKKQCSNTWNSERLFLFTRAVHLLTMSIQNSLQKILINTSDKQ
ncbi:hypothetical protein H6P81_010974 [Aristolochia fimbriata]|uniref:Glycosyl transferase family 51 domain-containing protein n=1 Tax=Aristolochia fimbriata TaxID=158543 RepID=A0AAV7EQY5_ARIFI|nr:hypothetical protein H6P81_010974 [Aristolochia fimbriata]